VRGGLATSVGEYSLSVAGPDPRATRHWELARQAGLKTVAKVQLNNSWELSTVPYLPVLDLVAEHVGNLAHSRVDGLMLSWSLGGYPSPNLEVAHEFAASPGIERETVLDRVARRRFGPEGAPHARRAWTAFSRAFREYPFDVGVLYQNPVQMGPANLLYPAATHYRATMTANQYFYLPVDLMEKVVNCRWVADQLSRGSAERCSRNRLQGGRGAKTPHRALCSPRAPAPGLKHSA
jgi:hypothetical protein